MLPVDKDFGSNGYSPPLVFGWTNIGTLDADPISGNYGELYFNSSTLKFRTYVGGFWYDLGTTIGALSASSILPQYFSTNIFGGSGTSSLVARSDHSHTSFGFLNGGNTWNGYQTQNSGGWAIADFLDVFATGNNVALTLSSNLPYTTSSAGNYIEASDINNSMRFKVDRIGNVISAGTVTAIQFSGGGASLTNVSAVTASTVTNFGIPTYIQPSKPTAASAKYAWWDTSGGNLTLWIEDGV